MNKVVDAEYALNSRRDKQLQIRDLLPTGRDPVNSKTLNSAESSLMGSQCVDQERPSLEHPVSRSHPIAIAPPTFPCHPEPSIPIDGYYEGSLIEKQAYRGTGKESTKLEGGRSRVTIDMFPDLVLLQIFDFYVDQSPGYSEWHTLVHVCQKWRNVVFGSPHRLDLRLVCASRTPVRETLNVWPPLPIVVIESDHEKWGVDNIIAVLEHADRICDLILPHFIFSISRWEQVLAAMLQPFPALTRLILLPIHESAPAVPASFLGGYAPRLQKLSLQGIPFPGLPKLLLTATHLVSLHLSSILPSGYISPKAMVTCLSALTRLEDLQIGFRSPRSRPDRRSRRPPPLTRSILPILTTLHFQGVSEYLEDLVAQIDAPLLNNLYITFSHQLIFDTPQVTQFISRTPKFNAPTAEAHIAFSCWRVQVTIPHRTSHGSLELAVSCRQSDWQLSSLAQVCNSSLPQALIPAVEYFYIESEPSELHWQDEIENSQWLELLHTFTAVKELYLSQEFGPRIAPVLKELVEEGATEMFLPALQTLFLEEPLPSGPVQEIIEQFVAARQLSSHPMALSIWNSRCYVIRS